jgi:sulfide:quinone oxidoreductase
MSRFAFIDADYSVSGQLDAAQIGEAASEGFKTIINLRPDAEKPGYISAADAANCAAGQGLDYHHIAVAVSGPTPQQIADFKALLNGCKKPVLAHCGTGRRAAIMWALVQKGQLPTEKIVGCCAAAGHDISALAARL